MHLFAVFCLWITFFYRPDQLFEIVDNSVDNSFKPVDNFSYPQLERGVWITLLTNCG